MNNFSQKNIRYTVKHNNTLPYSNIDDVKLYENQTIYTSINDNFNKLIDNDKFIETALSNNSLTYKLNNYVSSYFIDETIPNGTKYLEKTNDSLIVYAKEDISDKTNVIDDILKTSQIYTLFGNQYLLHNGKLYSIELSLSNIINANSDLINGESSLSVTEPIAIRYFVNNNGNDNEISINFIYNIEQYTSETENIYLFSTTAGIYFIDKHSTVNGLSIRNRILNNKDVYQTLMYFDTDEKKYYLIYNLKSNEFEGTPKGSTDYYHVFVGENATSLAFVTFNNIDTADSTDDPLGAISIYNDKKNYAYVFARYLFNNDYQLSNMILQLPNNNLRILNKEYDFGPIITKTQQLNPIIQYFTKENTKDNYIITRNINTNTISLYKIYFDTYQIKIDNIVIDNDKKEFIDIRYIDNNLFYLYKDSNTSTYLYIEDEDGNLIKSDVITQFNEKSPTRVDYKKVKINNIDKHIISLIYPTNNIYTYIILNNLVDLNNITYTILDNNTLSTNLTYLNNHGYNMWLSSTYNSDNNFNLDLLLTQRGACINNTGGAYYTDVGLSTTTLYKIDNTNNLKNDIISYSYLGTVSDNNILSNIENVRLETYFNNNSYGAFIAKEKNDTTYEYLYIWKLDTDNTVKITKIVNDNKNLIEDNTNSTFGYIGIGNFNNIRSYEDDKYWICKSPALMYISSGFDTNNNLQYKKSEQFFNTYVDEITSYVNKNDPTDIITKQEQLSNSLPADISSNYNVVCYMNGLNIIKEYILVQTDNTNSDNTTIETIDDESTDNVNDLLPITYRPQFKRTDNYQFFNCYDYFKLSTNINNNDDTNFNLILHTVILSGENSPTDLYGLIEKQILNTDNSKDYEFYTTYGILKDNNNENITSFYEALKILEVTPKIYIKPNSDIANLSVKVLDFNSRYDSRLSGFFKLSDNKLYIDRVNNFKFNIDTFDNTNINNKLIELYNNSIINFSNNKSYTLDFIENTNAHYSFNLTANLKNDENSNNNVISGFNEVYENYSRTNDIVYLFGQAGNTIWSLQKRLTSEALSAEKKIKSTPGGDGKAFCDRSLLNIPSLLITNGESDTYTKLCFSALKPANDLTFKELFSQLTTTITPDNSEFFEEYIKYDINHTKTNECSNTNFIYTTENGLTTTLKLAYKTNELFYINYPNGLEYFTTPDNNLANTIQFACFPFISDIPQIVFWNTGWQSYNLYEDYFTDITYETAQDTDLTCSKQNQILSNAYILYTSSYKEVTPEIILSNGNKVSVENGGDEETYYNVLFTVPNNPSSLTTPILSNNIYGFTTRYKLGADTYTNLNEYFLKNLSSVSKLTAQYTVFNSSNINKIDSIIPNEISITTMYSGVNNNNKAVPDLSRGIVLPEVGLFIIDNKFYFGNTILSINNTPLSDIYTFDIYNFNINHDNNTTTFATTDGISVYNNSDLDGSLTALSSNAIHNISQAELELIFTSNNNSSCDCSCFNASILKFDNNTYKGVFELVGEYQDSNNEYVKNQIYVYDSSNTDSAINSIDGLPILTGYTNYNYNRFYTYRSSNNYYIFIHGYDNTLYCYNVLNRSVINFDNISLIRQIKIHSQQLNDIDISYIYILTFTNILEIYKISLDENNNINLDSVLNKTQVSINSNNNTTGSISKIDITDTDDNIINTIVNKVNNIINFMGGNIKQIDTTNYLLSDIIDKVNAICTTTNKLHSKSTIADIVQKINIHIDTLSQNRFQPLLNIFNFNDLTYDNNQYANIISYIDNTTDPSVSRAVTKYYSLTFDQEIQSNQNKVHGILSLEYTDLHGVNKIIDTHINQEDRTYEINCFKKFNGVIFIGTKENGLLIINNYECINNIGFNTFIMSDVTNLPCKKVFVYNGNDVVDSLTCVDDMEFDSDYKLLYVKSGTSIHVLNFNGINFNLDTPSCVYNGERIVCEFYKDIYILPIDTYVYKFINLLYDNIITLLKITKSAKLSLNNSKQERINIKPDVSQQTIYQINLDKNNINSEQLNSSTYNYVYKFNINGIEKIYPSYINNDGNTHVDKVQLNSNNEYVLQTAVELPGNFIPGIGSNAFNNNYIKQTNSNTFYLNTSTVNTLSSTYNIFNPSTYNDIYETETINNRFKLIDNTNNTVINAEKLSNVLMLPGTPSHYWFINNGLYIEQTPTQYQYISINGAINISSRQPQDGYLVRLSDNQFITYNDISNIFNYYNINNFNLQTSNKLNIYTFTDIDIPIYNTSELDNKFSFYDNDGHLVSTYQDLLGKLVFKNNNRNYVLQQQYDLASYVSKIITFNDYGPMFFTDEIGFNIVNNVDIDNIPTINSVYQYDEYNYLIGTVSGLYEMHYSDNNKYIRDYTFNCNKNIKLIKTAIIDGKERFVIVTSNAIYYLDEVYRPQLYIEASQNQELFDFIIYSKKSSIVFTDTGYIKTQYKYRLNSINLINEDADIEIVNQKYDDIYNKHISDYHNDTSIISKINNKMPTNLSELKNWQYFDEDDSIRNDLVETIMFSDQISEDIVFVEYLNKQTKNEYKRAENITYIIKQYISNTNELYIHIPTTETHYVPHILGAQNGVTFNDNVSIEDNATTIKILLKKTYFNDINILTFNVNGTSLPLNISKVENTDNTYHSYILPTIALNIFNIQSDEYIELYATNFGTDTQDVYILFN